MSFTNDSPADPKIKTKKLTPLKYITTIECIQF
jgi:hypothetical protein